MDLSQGNQCAAKIISGRSIFTAHPKFICSAILNNCNLQTVIMLPEQDILSRTGLTPIVSQPTRGNNKLDRIYASDPTGYSDIKIVTSVVISEHKVIIAFNGPAPTC